MICQIQKIKSSHIKLKTKKNFFVSGFYLFHISNLRNQYYWFFDFWSLEIKAFLVFESFFSRWWLLQENLPLKSSAECQGQNDIIAHWVIKYNLASPANKHQWSINYMKWNIAILIKKTDRLLVKVSLVNRNNTIDISRKLNLSWYLIILVC